MTDGAPHTVFLLSPANLGGERAAMLFQPEAQFFLARQLQALEGSTLGDVFSFVSGLYFRGKKIYSESFARPPAGLPRALAITPGEGLRPLDDRVTLERLLAWKKTPVDVRNRAFVDPLMRHASQLERAHGADTRFVLLGSLATSKYVQPLTLVFGDHLLYPPEFVGRGDMSRGALLLRAARTGKELSYMPMEGARASTRLISLARH